MISGRAVARKFLHALGWPLDRSRRLWIVLVALVSALLVTLVWLSGRHEVQQVQAALDRDTADAAVDVRAALQRNVQELRALQAAGSSPIRWDEAAAAALHSHREWLRLEWRDADLAVLAHADSPFEAPDFDIRGRAGAQADVALACATARKLDDVAYSQSHFMLMGEGRGLEVMELCLPLGSTGRPQGYLVATYSLSGLLMELVSRPFMRGRQAVFADPDGTRLAAWGTARPGSRVFTSSHLLNLPGTTMVLTVNGRRSAPDLFPNVLTALVTAMSIALVSVLVLLVRDMRRRQHAEHELAEALAFRKAMEDSLVTGLRARDLQGRTTYVNPAFCQMVGYTPAELQGDTAPPPYWPPELAQDYAERQALRLSGQVPPREGFESVYQRKDGSRFPVLVIEAPLVNSAGQQTGWMSAMLDISEQRRIEDMQRTSQERLQATARLATVGEMASLLSHELNQPLAAIASYASGSLNLLDQAGEGGQGGTADALPLADLRLAVGRIAEQAGRAGKVIRSVHDFVRRRDQAREALAPQALLDAVMPLISLQARKLQVKVTTRLPGDLPPVWCDRTMVEQVLLNLARNAMQAMENAPAASRELTLQVQQAPSGGGWLMFSVTDRGPGIAGDVAGQLFTPFFTTRAEGMGLGLSLCRTVVEQHGGALDFVPHQPHGTVFRFTLPLARAGDNQPQE